MSKAETIDTVVGQCHLTRSKRKTLAISVLPDGTIELVAPIGSFLSDIVTKVKRRQRWIEKQRRSFAEMNSIRPPLKYRSGATHRYLGRQYRLKVRKHQKSSIKLKGAFFHISTPDNSSESIKVLLDSWMRAHALNQFSKRLTLWESWCQHRHLRKPRLHLRSMPKRWGSSHKDGRIFLNPDLVRTPSVCIDYVIAHEVCHLKHPNHDQDFYKQLNEMFPNWQAVKLRLEQAEF